jgi:hypothetical protein
MIKSNSEQINRSAFGLVTPDDDRQMYKILRCLMGKRFVAPNRCGISSI